MIDILTGQVQSGKTTLLRKIADELKVKGISVGGFLSLAVHREGKVTGYDLLDLSEGVSHPFLRKLGQMNWEKIGPYSFIPDTLDQAKKIIMETEKIDLCIVDEVGPLELGGKGLWPALEAATVRSPSSFLLTVRAGILSDFLKKLVKNAVNIFNIADEDIHPRIIAYFEQKFIRR